MIDAAMEKMKSDYQADLEQAKEALRAEFESGLQPVREQIMELAAHSQESVDAAVQHLTEHCQEVLHERDHSDWSGWALLDMEEFQDLKQRVEAE